MSRALVIAGRDLAERSRIFMAATVLGAIPFLVLAAAHWTISPLAQFGDWAQYMSHADALRHGRAYGPVATHRRSGTPPDSAGIVRPADARPHRCHQNRPP